MTRTARPLWVLRRALAMTPAEMALRLARAARDRRRRASLPLAQDDLVRFRDIVVAGESRGPASLLDGGVGSLLAGAADTDPTLDATRAMGTFDRTLAEAEAVLDGRPIVFGGASPDLGAPPAWLRDPVSGRDWPLVYWSAVDFRFDESVGDPRYVWEVNRAHHILPLARAFALTGERRYAEAVWSDVTSWIRDNPPCFGINWSSALEIAIRLVSWALALDIVGSHGAGERDVESVLISVSLQAGHLSDNLSTYASSKNNHLIGEAAGLMIAGTKFPYLRGAERWAAVGRRVLERELSEQVSTDGVSREQTFHYQGFVLEFCLLAEAAARAAGRPMSREFRETEGRMADFVASVSGPGTPPSIGDEDGGKAYRLGGDPSRQVLSAAACASTLVGKPRTHWERADDLEPALWFFGAEVVRERLKEEPGIEAEASVGFPEGGYYVSVAGDLRSIIDCGPLGYLSIAAHGHADCLSLAVAGGDAWILVDPGTYCYHREGLWRDHFRSTAAHNTVTVDGASQSEMLGPFMWGRRATARPLVWETGERFDYFEGSHDGYLGTSGVTHRRAVLFSKRGYLVVFDRLEGAGRHDLLATFQLAPGFSLAEDEGIRFAGDSGELAIFDRLPAGVVSQILEGQSEPPAGWVSREFGVKEPAPAYTASGNVALPAAMVFVILPGQNARARCGIDRSSTEGISVTVETDRWSETVLMGVPDLGTETVFRGVAGLKTREGDGPSVAYGLRIDEWKESGAAIDHASGREQRRPAS